jgi:hypothetical protein
VRPDLKVSEQLFRHLIVREMSLESPGLTEWDTVNRIRDWAYANSDFASESALLDQDPRFRFHDRSALEIFMAFFQDRGGVWCGGAAFALMRLYTLFGFPASVLTYGHGDAMTHVVTLVRITVNGRPMTVVQDPTFNLSYVTDEDAPLDYFDLLAALGRHGHRQIRFLRGTHKNRDVLVHPQDDESSYAHVVGSADRPERVLENGLRKYRSRVLLARFERAFRVKIRAFLRNQGYPGHPLYLHRFPVEASDQEILDQAQRLTQRGPSA